MALGPAYFPVFAPRENGALIPQQHTKGSSIYHYFSKAAL